MTDQIFKIVEAKQLSFVETLGPAFRSNAVFLPMGLHPLQNSITATIGATLPVSLLRGNLS